MRDRETILDTRHHRAVWTSVGEPGAVLADGKIAGTWRPRKSGRKLTLTFRFSPWARRSADNCTRRATEWHQRYGGPGIMVYRQSK